MSLAHAAPSPSAADRAGAQLLPRPAQDNNAQLALDDGWDATGVLIFATSLLTLGGSGVLLLLRVAGWTS